MQTAKYEPRTFRLSTAMHSAWVIAITAFTLSTITQAGNYTTVTVGKNGRFGFKPPLFVVSLSDLRIETLIYLVLP